MSYTPPRITFTISTTPGPNGQSVSFTDLFISASTTPLFPPSSVIDGWCLDRSLPIYSNVGTGDFTGWYYEANLYSSYETALLQTATPAFSPTFLANLGQLDSANWLLNAYYTQTVPVSYNSVIIAPTWQNVQGSLWTLLGSDGSPNGSITGGDAAQIGALAAAAQDIGDGYLPDAGQYIGIVVDSTLYTNLGAVYSSSLQPLMVPTLAAKLGDFVWVDSNANGVQETGEPGLNGVTVTLWRDLNSNGVFDGGAESLQTTVTGSVSGSDDAGTPGLETSGYYQFKGLTPGLPYQVQFTQPANYSFTSVNAGGNAALDSDAGAGGNSSVVVLTPGVFNRSIDAGVVPLPGAALGDRVWEDTNANGLQDNGEAGIAGATVELFRCVNNAPSGAVIATASTGANGSYAFTGLAPGDYIVRFTSPAGGYLQTTANVNGNDAVDSDAGAGGLTGCYTLASGQTDNTVDAGFYKPASLGDRVWVDANGNGQQDNGEAGAPGVTVELYACVNNAPAGPALASTTTNASGLYNFAGLKPGDYIVKFITPGGFVLTQGGAVAADASGTDSDAGTGGFSGCVNLGSGETETRVDAGLYQGAALGDRVWEDTNANGLQDNGEAGIAGATVELFRCVNNAPSGAVIATASTGANGSYAFTGLAPGDYIVRFTSPAGGYLQTTANVNGNDAVDSDAGAGGLTGCYTLASGQTNNTVDAGFYKPASLGDRVWVDANGNGQQDNGEAGAPGVTVELYACVNNAPAGPALASTTTNASGLYNFAGLKPGDYIVKFITPGGFVLTQGGAVAADASGTDSDAGTGGFSGCVNLGSGETETRVDAGLYQGAALGDRVWEDTNANGLQDNGEAGIAGATVELFRCVNNAPSGAVIATASTGANGSYAFTGLAPGDYIVRFTSPAGGYLQTTANVNGNDAVDSDAGAGGLTGCYTLASGQTNNTVDAGFYKPASLGDRVWVDANGNGQQDNGEAGAPGVTVELYACVNNAPAGPALASTTTNASGLYNFAGLKPGDYIVKFITPGGFVLTQGGAVAADASGTDSDAGTGGFSGCVNLGSGETETRVDAGLYQGAALGDRVWEDTNANGLQDNGEAGIAGATVELFRCVNNAPSGAVIATASTGANGSYAFTGLAPGDYIVRFTSPAGGYLQTTANVNGNDAVDSDAGAGGLTGCYTLASGQTNNTVDAGFYKPASLGDRVWVDANGNGQQDNGEAGAPGVTVELYACVNNAPAGPALASTTTNASGLYNFAGLKPGDYIVKFITPGGFVLTQGGAVAADASGTDSDAGTGGFSGCVNLGSGETETRVDAGLYQGAALGDRVWEDTNANGLQDNGEAGIAGATVELFRCVNNAPSGAVIATASTGANGSYAFTGLAPGDYIVRFTSPAGGYLQTTANVNGNDAVDSDAGAGGLTGCYTLASGQTNNTVDAGFYKPASLGDRVWVDANGNGQQDNGEAGAPGVTVELYACVNNAPAGPALASTTTNASGLYNFAGLKPGDYIVKFITPGGFVLTQGGAVAADASGTDSDAGTGGFSGCVNLGSGETETRVDAGLYQGAALGDRVWEDTNANGLQDNGEAGIAGATVELFRCVNNAPSGAVIATASTGANGSYAFTGLAPGDYIVRFTSPAGGYLQTTANVNGNDAVDSDAGAGGLTGCYTLASGQTNNTVDAGFYKPASLGDRVWVDANGNGQQDNGEAGAPGVTVELYACVNNAPAGPALASTTTNASGLYNFAGLKPGDYIVKFITPGGFVLTQGGAVAADASGTDSDAGTGGFSGCVNLGSGETETRVDAGLYQGAALGDRVWEDTNANGLQDNGEAGIAGATVELFRCVNNAPSGAVIATASTGANGSYAFTGLAPGDYIVRFTSPAGGYLQTTANVNGNDAVDSDAGAGGLTGCYTLASGQTNNTVDAGFYKPASLGDRVWVDANGNGQQDNGEAGAPGVTVELYACVNNAPAGPALASTTTNASGLYNFAGLKPGDYIVKFITPGGFVLTQGGAVAADASGTDSDAGTGGFSGCVNLGSGETETRVDAGLYQGAALGDRVWEDTNANGLQDNGEAGIAGATVELFRCVNNAPSGAVIATASTGANGSYAFTGLAPGDYIVRFTSPAGGYLQTTANVNGNDAVDSDAGAGGLTGCYTLASGQTDNTVDAGFYKPASLGDRVWVDANGNGQQDNGEAGAPGVTVELYACVNNAPAGPALASTTTNASGLYNFAGLKPGDYIVKFITPGGFVLTQGGAVAADASGTDSDAGTGGFSGCVNLGSGETETRVDAGLYQGAALGDRVWEDTNANGLQDNGEAGIAGATVELFRCVNNAPSGAVIATASTGANGSYAFTGLAPGDYIVRFTSPAGGYLQTTANVNGNDAVDSDAGAGGLTGCYTLASGQTNNTVDAGFYKPASLGDRVWVDANGDGLQNDGATGISGLAVTLIGGGSDKVIGTADDTNVTTVTGTDGFYRFNGLTPGVQYQVMFSKPAGTNYTAPDASSNTQDTLDSDANLATGKSPVVTLSSGEYNSTVDAGVVAAASIDLIKTARVDDVDCPTGSIGAGSDMSPTVPGVQVAPGVDLGNLTNYLFVFANGSSDANWQGATKGFVGDVVVDGLQAKERTSGGVPFAGTIYTNASTLDAWQGIVNQNPGQAFGQTGQSALVAGVEADLVTAIKQVNGMAATPGYTSVSSTSLNGLNTQDGVAQTYVINITSGLQVSSQIKITGDASDVFVLRWDTDANPNNGFQGQTKFQSGGAIVPQGGLTAGNFVNVAGDINASGGGSTPAAPFPQGPRADDGTGALAAGAKDFSGGGFFTGYWLTTGAPTQLDAATGLYIGATASLSNGIFVGGWYSLTTKFSMTSGTSGVHVCPNLGTLSNVILEVDNPFNPNNVGIDGVTANGLVGDLATYTYKVTNTGATPLQNVKVLDDNATAILTDDFFAAAVLKVNGKNFGDVDSDGLLDSGECWYFQAKEYATAAGNFTNSATVSADYAGGQVLDTDVALIGILPDPHP